MQKTKQLTADTIECPHCFSSDVLPFQAGYFVNTLLLSCHQCGLTSIFKGPTVEKNPADEKFVYQPKQPKLPGKARFR